MWYPVVCYKFLNVWKEPTATFFQGVIYQKIIFSPSYLLQSSTELHSSSESCVKILWHGTFYIESLVFAFWSSSFFQLFAEVVPLKHADNYGTVVSTTAMYVRSQYLTFGLETNPHFMASCSPSRQVWGSWIEICHGNFFSNS